MSIHDEITRINQAKTDLKNYLTDNGVEVSGNEKINELVGALEQTSSGSGDYVDLTSAQTITGYKDFTGGLQKDGIDVATTGDLDTLQGDLGFMQSDIDNLLNDTSTLRADVEGLQLDISNLDGRVATLESGGSGGGSMVGTPVVTGTQAIPKGTEIPLAMLMTVVPSGYTPVRLIVEDLNEGTLIIGGGGTSLFSTGFLLDITFTSSTQAAAVTALWMNAADVNWTRRTLNLSTTSLLMTTTQSPSTTIAYTIYLKKS